MSGSVSLVKSSLYRAAGNRPRVRLVPTARRESVKPLEAVVCAFIVTCGLFAGTVAVVPQAIIGSVPVVHVALAFFVPFSALFALSSLNPKKVIGLVIQGFLITLLVGAVGFFIA